MDYFEKIESKPKTDLAWNLPEQKQGRLSIIGGNKQSFRTEVKTAEYLAENYLIKDVVLVLPDSLKAKLPDLPGLEYIESTESGSIGDEARLKRLMDGSDYNILLGDLTKNAETVKVVNEVARKAVGPTVVTRDTVDLVAEGEPERVLMNEQIIMIASMPQLIKILRAVYYPKMLLLSQSLLQVVEVLHKFTLSYPARIVTLHSGQVIVAENGVVKAVALEKTGYLPMNFWNGEIVVKIAVLNMFNPGQFVQATVEALYAK